MTRSQLNLRLSDKKKAKWKKFLIDSDFTDLTKLIKYCVDGYIDGLLIEKHKIQQIKNNNQREKQLDEIIKILTEQRETLLSRLNGMKQAGLEEQDIMNTQQAKNQILKFLEKVGKATNDEISEVIGIKLPKTQKILNQLEVEQRLIRMNKDSSYELVKEANVQL